MTRVYSKSQLARRVWLTGRIAKQAMADDEYSEDTCVDPKFQREVDRIDRRAEEEGGYRQYEARRHLDEARRTAAAAKVRLDAAAPKDRRHARITKNDAEAALKRAERAARKAGI
ncbi:hypothetical protein DMA15_03775 [Streptomyces sp. WAC 01529]|uniref:hypothetical protein n=1 Tax=Streptomyces sp. WAC 01529 TaxID=2203205 RepID=UPI000F6E00A3|nr:hypothetical protein [Streptomyces sp. WAC 01529]AZM51813.1 hypothetical protein DMA15_03775 [Streptomyces sp. WAC 01529]